MNLSKNNIRNIIIEKNVLTYHINFLKKFKIIPLKLRDKVRHFKKG